MENKWVLKMKEITENTILIKRRMSQLLKGKLSLEEASKYAAMDIDIAKDVHIYLQNNERR